MRNVVKFLVIILKSFLIFTVVGGLTSAIVKNIEKTVLVESFKSKGVLQEDISTSKIKYYLIESDDNKQAFIERGNNIYIGAPGDILVSTQATLIGPITSGFVSFFAGGHAAFCTDEYADYQIRMNEYTAIEATGLDEGDNPADVFSKDYWSNNGPFTEVIGLRVNMTDNERKIVQSEASSIIGDLYNYSFIFNTTNTSYCTDIITKAFSKIGKNLNKDDFSASVYDLIVSRDTYISYYHYYDSNDVLHIYYLG